VKRPFLIGKNLYLRALDEKDIEGNYIQWLNDEEVCKYNSHFIFPYNNDSAKNYIHSVAKLPGALVLAIVLKENDLHIGNVSLQNINYINQNAEFAIIIGEKKYWGYGYSKEAAYLILRHGFMEMNLHRIYCGTASYNLPMQKLALSLGMVKEGIRHEAMYKHGNYLDIIEYGILKNDFFGRSGSKTNEK
jgi:[ribosomal protein S5]-alanine N-acetyltransferase